MSKNRDLEYIEDILVSLKRIKEYISDYTFDDFLVDYKTQDAIVRNIEIIGEASKKLSLELKNKYNKVPWKLISGTRDKLIHDYFGVNIDIVWEIATIDVPILEKEINKIKDEILE